MKNVRICHDKGCYERAIYPAPRSNRRLDEYIWFCFSHIKEYNKNWNYFEGMSQSEIIMEVSMGERRETKTDRSVVSDIYGLCYGRTGRVDRSGNFLYKILDEETIEGLRAMGLCLETIESTVDVDMGREVVYEELLSIIKVQYKELVKDLHPDLPGVKDQGEEFKRIDRVYRSLVEVLSR